MIIQHSGSDNPWHRAAAGWLVGTMSLMLMAYVTLDESNVQTYSLTLSAFIAVGVPALLYAIGTFRPKKYKLTTYAAVLGTFAYGPILTALLAPLYFLILIYPFTMHEVSAIVGGTALIASVATCVAVRSLRWSLANSRFIDKQFVEGAHLIFVRRDTIIELPRKPGLLSEHFGTRLRNLFSNTIYLLPLAYFAQRMASDAAGAAGVLMLISVLSVPLAIHVLSQLVRGYYLWIHVVRGIERTRGKSVIVNAY